MKNFLSAFLMVITIFSVTPAQAKTDFNPDGDLKNKFVELTTGRVPAGVVVNIQTYLSIRKEPSIYASEVARIPNGTRIGISEGSSKNGFYYIYCWLNNNFLYGYAHSDYIRYTGGYFELP